MVGHFSIINTIAKEKKPMRVRILSFLYKKEWVYLSLHPSITFNVLENKKKGCRLVKF